MLLGLLKGEEAKADIPLMLAPQPPPSKPKPPGSEIVDSVMNSIAGKMVETPKVASPLKQAPQGIIKPSMASKIVDAPKPKPIEMRNKELARPIVEPIMQGIAGNELVTPKIPSPSNLNLVPPSIARPDLAPEYKPKGTAPVEIAVTQPGKPSGKPSIAPVPKPQLKAKIEEKAPEVVSDTAPIGNLLIGKMAEQEEEEPTQVLNRGMVSPLTDINDVITAPSAEFSMENLNRPLTEAGFDSRIAEGEKDIAGIDKDLAKSAFEGRIEDLDAFEIARRKSPYIDRIEKIIEGLEKEKKTQLSAPEPQMGKPDRVAELINAFGGAGLNMLMGGTMASQRAGSAATQAGLKANEEVAKRLNENYQNALKNKRAIDLQVIKNLDRAQTEALKAYLNLEGMDSREFKDQLAFQLQLERMKLDATKEIYGTESTQYNNAKNYFLNMNRAMMDAFIRSTGQVIDIQDKQDQRDFIRDENQKNRENQLKVAEIAANARLKAAARRAIEARPDIKLTENQAKSLDFYIDYSAAMKDYNALLEKTNYRPPSATTRLVSEVYNILNNTDKPVPFTRILGSSAIKELTKSDTARRELIAMLTMTNVVARKSSGAAVNASEWDNFVKQHGINYGDSPDIVKLRQQSWRNKTRSLYITIGNQEARDEADALIAGNKTFDEIQQESKDKQKSKAPSPTGGTKPSGKTEERRQYSPKLNKTRIIYSDGSVEVVDGKQTK